MRQERDEAHGDTLWNTAVIIGNKGNIIGKHRKARCATMSWPRARPSRCLSRFVSSGHVAHSRRGWLTRDPTVGAPPL